MNAPEKVLPVKSPFERLYSMDVSKHIEKKGSLSYLSWTWAVAELMKVDQDANWQMHQPTTYPDGSMMVACTVTAFGKPVYMWLPVMDNKNRAIQNPNAFDINKAMMRCLTKAIACHGLGLFIFAGDDLPETPEPTEAEIDAAVQALEVAADSGEEMFQKAIGKVSEAIKAKIPPNTKKALVARSKAIGATA